MSTSLKNICTCSGSKAVSCVLQPPRLQIPAHRNTEGCLYDGGAIFTLTMWDQVRVRGKYGGHSLAVTLVARDLNKSSVYTAECSQSSWNVKRLLQSVYRVKSSWCTTARLLKEHFIIWLICLREVRTPLILMNVAENIFSLLQRRRNTAEIWSINTSTATFLSAQHWYRD